GVVFLVMEYLSGRTLKELIRQEGPMPLARAVEILRQVGGALNTAHAEGVVHRDLKSDNIMLLSSSGTDYAKVLDFGIAKIKERDGAYDPGLTAADSVIGTPQYMSPEQCSQSPDIDARSDIYSLGVILYEMLTGRVPFTGESPTAIMLKHLQQPVPSISEQRPDLPSGVARVVARAMEKQPDARYATVAELVEDFTIAAGMEAPSRSSVGNSKLVAPAHASPPLSDDADEETIVRRRVTRAMTPPPLPAGPLSDPSYVAASTSSFNPWKVLIPSMLGLLVIFAVIYAFTRNSGPATATPQDSSLTADPNSQPVEAASPATGLNEAGIAAGGVANPGANVNMNANASPSPSSGENPGDVPGVNINENDNANENTNTRKAPPVPLPSPARPIDNDQAPAPTPVLTKPPTPKPTLPPPSAAPPEMLQ
ncbi:MAG: protein kinase, partial [Pyrinomonadaceae bacterium]